MFAWKFRGVFFNVPWVYWRDMKETFGKKFLMPDDIPELEVVFDGAVKFLDYVSSGFCRDEEE